ncbi:ABC transporter permease [Patulibacter americanus]|uniref:ABC transporter permease n=1 Tax=Patulibacter americanus TaxID=588672 RepID=UPI0003B461A3|nr:FtsX-like permease family protein [Patulibacter americanus]
MSGWLRDLALGARLAISGGRGAWVRTAMTAVGVGLGVALLLLAASFPTAIAARDDRTSARDDYRFGVPEVRRGPASLLIADAPTVFRGVDVRGRLVQPEGPDAPLPPGLDRLPRAGEVVVSPRLQELLDRPDAALLRPRIPGRVVGTIGDAGLEGPVEAAYYAGAADLSVESGARRIDRFGSVQPDEGLDPVLAFLVVVAVVVLLLPVAVFVAAAARFGGEARDRRLAALRLVGADRRGVRRIAAGESLVGALGGLLVGAVVFGLATRVVPELPVASLSLFASDVRPALPLALLVLLAVPAVAVVVTQIALTRVAIDPLGVVRRGATRSRRLAWRLALPVVGLLLLVPLLGVDLTQGEGFNPVLTSAGVVLLLVGVTALLPWLVEALVDRLDGRGGVAWQLAVRRLQLDRGASARTVSGIAVAVAGAIALTSLFGAVEDDRAVATGADLEAAQAQVYYTVRPGRDDAAQLDRRLAAVPGVRSVLAWSEASITEAAHPDRSAFLTVASCSTLRRLARIRSCQDGDAFVTPEGPAPGASVRIAETGPWRVPADARRVVSDPKPSGGDTTGVLATPSAAADLTSVGATYADVALDARNPDHLEGLRNAAAAVTPLAVAQELQSTRDDRDLAAVRRAVYAGAVAVLALIAASMVVAALEGLHERRRLLASLVAFGTPPRTLGRSLLLQTAVPVALGLVLAIGVGLGLGALLLRIVGSPVRFDVVPILGIAAVGAAVVPVVTALTVPALRRIVRPDGLRTE